MWPFRKKQSQRLSQDNIERDRRTTEPKIATRQQLIDQFALMEQFTKSIYYENEVGDTILCRPNLSQRNQSMLDDYKRACEAAWQRGEWAPSLGEPLL